LPNSITEESYLSDMLEYFKNRKLPILVAYKSYPKIELDVVLETFFNDTPWFDDYSEPSKALREAEKTVNELLRQEFYCYKYENRFISFSDIAEEFVSCFPLSRLEAMREPS
jgi:hypothetical protein